MKKVYSLLIFFITGASFSASGMVFTLSAGNDFYYFIDRLDSTRSSSTRIHNYNSLGFSLENIGQSGLSLHSNLLATNAFMDKLNGGSTHKFFELSTGYLDWRNSQGILGIRLGRQHYTNLSLDFSDMDALRISIHPDKKSRINVAAGLRVPTSYGKEVISSQKELQSQNDLILKKITYKHDFFSTAADGGFFLVDGSISTIPFTTLTAAIALVPAPYMRPRIVFDSIPYIDTINSKDDSDDEEKSLVPTDSLVWGKSNIEADNRNDFRVALGVDFSPVPFVRLIGSGRFSSVEKSLDHIDSRLTLTPFRFIELSTYLLHQKGIVDSTNLISMMFYGPYTEYGISLNVYPSTANICLQGDYHAMVIKNEGTDQFLSFQIGYPYVSAGAGISLGYHGETFRSHAAISLPVFKIFSFEGAGEFYRAWPAVYHNEHKIRPTPYNAVYFSGGTRLSISSIGLTVQPRMEYIINRYYRNDIRFLCTTNLFIREFRGGNE